MFLSNNFILRETETVAIEIFVAALINSSTEICMSHVLHCSIIKRMQRKLIILLIDNLTNFFLV